MSKEKIDEGSEADLAQYDFEEFISRYRELEDEISEHRRVKNIQAFAAFGGVIALLLLFTAISRSNLFEKETLPSFFLPIINATEGIVRFVETDIFPLIDSIPLVAVVFAFVIFLGVTVLFASRRGELEVDNRDVFKSKIAGAAVSLSEDSPDQAVKELRSAIQYGSPRRVLPKYQVEQIRDFLSNVDKIETEEEAKEKVGIVLEELISEFEEDSAGRLARINEELGERAQADRADRSHFKTFIDVVDNKLISEPRRFDVVAGGSIIATFLLGFQQFALLLATLFAGARLSDYFG